MGWVTTHTDRRGVTTFTARYRDYKDKQQVAGTFPTQAKAEKAWQQAEAQQQLGRLSDPKRGRQRFENYVREQWLPHHQMEASTREGYVYLLNRYIIPEFGRRPMRELVPGDVRAWVLKLQQEGVRRPTIKNCKIVLGAILTTALNDQITFLHASRGVKTPPVPRKSIRIITAEQFNHIYAALHDPVMQLLVETDIESGLRWGELTELRPKDLDPETGILTISRAVVHLKSKSTPDDQRFVVKNYPKEGKWRDVKLAPHMIAKLLAHAQATGLSSDDLLFAMPSLKSKRRCRPATLPDPLTLGFTERNEKGRCYRHGTKTAYQAARCRCTFCRDAMSAYRAERRSAGKDAPRQPRAVRTDGHIPNDWFRAAVWTPALTRSGLGFHVTPHGLRHAHASWLLNGGADLQVVKERLGHGSISKTERYLHSLPGAHDAALTALDNSRGRRSVPDPAPSNIAPPTIEIASTEIEELRAFARNFAAMVEGVKSFTER